jgi:hypothetical protein
MATKNKMISSYYILILRQIGNIGAHEIKKIDNQPKEGFDSENDAEKHLNKLIKEGEYPFDSRWGNNCIISKIYKTQII